MALTMLPLLALVITFSSTGTSALAVNKHAQMKLLKEDFRALRGDLDLEISNPQGTVRMAEVLRRRRGSLADQQDYVDAHNEARFAVSPKAANMKKMKWSAELAQVAENYAKKCLWAHNPERTKEAQTMTSQFSYVGENLYVTSADSVDPRAAVLAWDNEKASYNYTSLQCTGVCGHYTQVVWANSEFVGCASNTCPTFEGLPSSFDAGTIVVCNYGQGGNYNGQQPYMTGTPCTSCPRGYSCTNDLCVSDGDDSGSGTSSSTGQDGDCYVGDGSDYQGSANSTVSGKPCLVWSTFYDFLPSNNYCKNYFAAYGVTEPVCYIQPGSHYVEACGVRKCDAT
ncbi:peptidase inhibitor R3HDML-like [Crassostrea virginica]